jgi:hypothetical protein
MTLYDLELLQVHLKHLDGHIEEVNICLPIMLTLSLGFPQWNRMESFNLYMA